MARPKKPPESKKSVMLQIPLSADEKRLIVEAATVAGKDEFTGWARETLLGAARKLLRANRAQPKGETPD